MSNRFSFSKERGVRTVPTGKPDEIRCGYPHGRKDIPENYLVRINSKDEAENRHVFIRTALQEKLLIRTTSQWEPFTSVNWLSKKAKEAYEAAYTLWTGEVKTLYPSFLTRRHWTSTSPLTFTLSLKFEALDDPRMEVIKPCQELQRMSLPLRKGEGSWNVKPPGPNPYHFGGRDRGNVINVHIGSFLLFKQVILRETSVEFAPRLTTEGFPISAAVNIVFETFEVITADALDTEVYTSAVYFPTWFRKEPGEVPEQRGGALPVGIAGLGEEYKGDF